MKKRLLSLLLCIVMILGILPLAVSAAEESYRTNVNVDKKKANADFMTDLRADTIGATFLGAHEMMITKEGAIQGNSLRIHHADIRWWGFDYVEATYIARAQLKLNETENPDIRFVMQTQDKEKTNTENTEGWIILIKVEEGKLGLYVRDGEAEKLVKELSWGETYNIELIAERRTDVYDLYVNDELVADDTKFLCKVNKVTSYRWQFYNCDAYFDNFIFATKGKEYPQQWSVQAPGEMPEIDYPEEYVYDGVYRVYHNTVRQDFSAKDLVVVKGDAWLNAAKVLPLVKGDAVVTLDGDNKTVSFGDKVIDLSSYLSVKNDMEMISLSAINKIFGVKVWLDDAEHMIYITTGSYMSDNFLRACGYRFVMNGEPYYELSFNKFDLSTRLLDYFFGGEQDASVPAAEEKSLKTLADNGFKTIRVFVNNPWVANPDSLRSETGKATYYKSIDYMLDLCDKYGIRVVMSLQLETAVFHAYDYEDGTYVDCGELDAEIIANPESASRKFVYSYLDEFINKYKDRETVLMWEISNEINLDADVGPAVGVVMASAIQSGNFYKDITEYINAIDKNHLVDSGDAGMRDCSYSLLTDTMAGRSITWKKDSVADHYKIMYIFNHGINVMSIHSAGTLEYFNQVMQCARSFDKPLYVGETGDLAEGEGLTIMSPESLPQQKEFLNVILESGLQLLTWWDFDAPLSNEEYKKLWNVTLETTPDLFYAIADTNRKLQAKWKVNGVNAPATAESSLLYGDKVPFTDVPADAWYYGDVVTAYHSGLINGTSASTYAPANELLYCEAVKLAACMNQKTYEGVVTLTVGNPWYQPYVDYASANGIIAGEYDWNAKATRAGYLSIFANALKDADLAPINEVPDGSIPDVPMTHPQAEAIYKLYRAGIIQGTDEAHSCSPDTNISRSEMAAILTRMMDATKRVNFTMG